MSHLIINFILLLMSFHSALAAYNIASFGAQSNLETDSTRALASAWAAACSSAVPSGIYVPRGLFYIGPITLTGPRQSSGIRIQIDGTLVAPSDYTSGRDWIVFNKVESVSIYGGVLDGRGASLWACKAAGQNCPFGSTEADHLKISPLISERIWGFQILSPNDPVHPVFSKIQDDRLRELNNVQTSHCGTVSSFSLSSLHPAWPHPLNLQDSPRTGDTCLELSIPACHGGRLDAQWPARSDLNHKSFRP